MIKLVFCCRRKEGMTREEFQTRWLDEHGPLVRKVREHLPMMKRYVQSHSLPDEISEGDTVKFTIRNDELVTAT